MNNTLILRLSPLRAWLARPLVRRALPLAYAALLTLMLLQPSSRPYIGRAAPPGPPDLGREMLLTTGHVVGFGLLTLLWAYSLNIRLPIRRAAALAVLIALALSVTTEVAQTLVPDRSPSWFDLAVNAVVALAAAGWLARISPDKRR